MQSKTTGAAASNILVTLIHAFVLWSYQKLSSNKPRLINSWKKMKMSETKMYDHIYVNKFYIHAPHILYKHLYGKLRKIN